MKSKSWQYVVMATLLTGGVCVGAFVNIPTPPNPEKESEVIEVINAETESETESEIGTEIEFEIVPETEITIAAPTGYRCEWADLELTEWEFELICTTVFCEAGNQPFDTQVLTALVILNQVASGDFGNGVEGIIYRNNGNNFTVTKWKDFEERGWTSQVEEAVLFALENNNHPRDMYYFRTGHYHNFGTPYKKSGAVYFSTN